MVIAVGSDHRGFAMKSQIMEYLCKKGYKVVDFGTDSADSVDYTDFAIEVAEAVAGKKVGWGILLCYSGLGMVMAANKVRGVRAALCTNATYARFARAHNDANVLVMPAGFMEYGAKVRHIIRTFINTRFEGGRHRRRVKKMVMYEDSANRI